MIQVERAHLFVAAATNPGKRGKNNEDRFSVSAFHQSKDNPSPSVLAVVADGVGGNRAGEIAAELSVRTISQKIAASDAAHPLEELIKAIQTASQQVQQKARANPEFQGMSTTCSCVWVIENRLFSANVGDSRIYLIREHTIRQLSTDHTWIREAIDNGLITPEQAKGHPNSHVIRRYLGGTELPEVDTRMHLAQGESDSAARENQGQRLLARDMLLLCSDGLTDLVTDAEILAILESNQGEPALNQLIELANQRGGHDNITTVLLQVPAEPILSGEQKQSRRWLRSCLIAVLGLSVLIFGVMAGSWLINTEHSRPNETTQFTESSMPGIQLSPSMTPIHPTQGTEVPKFSTALPTAPATGTTPVLFTPTILQPTLTPWPTNTSLP